MSDIMRPVSFEKLLAWALEEHRKEGHVFGVTKIVRYNEGEAWPIFSGRIESQFGPAAGPHTQLAQNIAAAYLAGARFFELKTVQRMDGRELAACVAKPCIAAADECYNCEWSTELTVGEAFDEYVKAWFLCRILSKELSLGDPDALVFNMSVGYDLDGIKTEKIDRYIEGMKDASGTPVFGECMRGALAASEKGLLVRADEAYIRSIPARISDSITESTLHGCPPDEIERIASYLITKKHLNTYVKCNPTLLGYDFARKTLDELGFDYVAFDDHHFKEDLQWEDAVPMFRRLTALCAERGLEFGVKLTNTFPVDVKAGELPSEEMYMSGRALFPLTTELAARIAREFGGALRISYSGGADIFNIRMIRDAGIWPVTLATTILKPGGYERLSEIAEELTSAEHAPFSGVDPEKAAALSRHAREDARYRKSVKGTPPRKMEEPLPLLDCFAAPCRSSCPIGQDIPGYLHALNEGREEDALRIILDRNALPFITGTICPHTCGTRCMRNHYEGTVRIREAKLLAAESAWKVVLKEMKEGVPANPAPDRRIAVVGGGPAGLAAARFLSRAGLSVTLFEARERLGGIPRYVIPEFRISEEAIERDIELALSAGVKTVTGRKILSVRELKDEGFTDIVLAIGAMHENDDELSYGRAEEAQDFLERVKNGTFAKAGPDVAVLGGGNTAMDAARMAKRLPGVQRVRLIYRRTRRYMPADEEELMMALADGVEFCELLSPKGVKEGVLTCDVCRLGAPDASGRRAPEKTGETCDVPANLVITAFTKRILTSLYVKAGADLDRRGKPVTDEHMQTTVPGLYAIGDGRQGPSTVVKAIADAARAAEGILASCGAGEALFGAYEASNTEGSADAYRAKRGILKREAAEPDDRCLGCPAICEACVEVCPNRANIAVKVPGLAKEQILHVDGMCNECGNCAVFCPHAGRPYRDKLTLFTSQEDFENSENQGFLVCEGTVRVRLGGQVTEVNVFDAGCGLYEPVRQMIVTVMRDYGYLL